MNSVSVLKIKTVDPQAVVPKSHKQNYVKRKSGPISLLSVLDAENFRLRQAVVELSLDTLALREALKELRPGPRISGRGLKNWIEDFWGAYRPGVGRKPAHGNGNLFHERKAATTTTYSGGALPVAPGSSCKITSSNELRISRWPL